MRALPSAAVLLLLAFGSAAADPKADAKVQIDKATAAHAANKFDEALVALQAAYALDPQPGLLYAIAQVQVKLERCADAIRFYEKFIATNPGDKAAKAANEAIAACKAQLASQPKPEPKPEPAPDPKPEPKPEIEVDARSQPQPAPPRRDETRARWKDPLGGALVGAGVIAGAIGVVLYRGASADIDKAERAENYGNSEDLVDGAKSKRRNATIAGAVGGALVIGGVIRYVTAGKQESTGVAVVPVTGGGAVTWSGRW